jgi:hypothetical protein
MVAVLTASPTRSKVRPHVSTASSRRYERRRPEKTPLFKVVSEYLEGWLESRVVAEQSVLAHIEREGPPAGDSCRLGLFPKADLATLTEKVRRRVVRWFRMQRLLDGDAAADMHAREKSGLSVDASVRIALIDRDVPSYFQSVEHLLRYCGRPPFALERLSVRRGADGRITRVRYVLPRHKAANLVGPGARAKVHATGGQWRRRTLAIRFSRQALGSRAAAAEASASPAELKQARGCSPRITSSGPPSPPMTRGNVGKRCDAVTGGYAVDGHAAGGEATGDCRDSRDKPRSHDTSRTSLGHAHGAGGRGVSEG